MQDLDQYVQEPGTRLDKYLPKMIAKYGILTAVLLMVYFSLAAWLDFAHLIQYRYFNLIFMIIGVVAGLRAFHRKPETKYTSYLNGMVLGAGISALASVIFSAFSLFLLSFVAPEAGLKIQQAIVYEGITPSLISLVILIEGTFSGIMVSFVAMQYFKNVD